MKAKAQQLAPDQSEWGTDYGNDGNRDLTEGERLELGSVEPSQVKGFRRERLWRFRYRIDVQSDLVLEHMRIKMIPMLSLKHSLIIHRRGMRARLWR